jgi:cAMP phosphodiesterase
MKIQLLPSTFEPDGTPSTRQHLSCLVINDRVAIDAGSLGMAATDAHRRGLRDIVLTHAHLDHIAGLPLFIDDLFATLSEPVRVFALKEVIEVLERDVFNWSVFPRFSELSVGKNNAIEYFRVRLGESFECSDIPMKLFAADHKVPSAGVLVSDKDGTVAITGDTATLAGLRKTAAETDLKAVVVECAFPDELETIAGNSHHMTPAMLARELELSNLECPIFVFNIKPNYLDAVVRQLTALNVRNLEVMDVGRPYFW